MSLFVCWDYENPSMTLDGVSDWLEQCGTPAALVNEIVAALADLQVGQTYVDSDGDTWERVE